MEFIDKMKKKMDECEREQYEVDSDSPYLNYPKELAALDAIMGIWRSRHHRCERQIIKLAQNGDFDLIPDVAEELNDAAKCMREIVAERKKAAKKYPR